MKRLFVPLLAFALAASLLVACKTTEPPPPKPKPKPGGFHTPTPAPVSPDASTEESTTPKKAPGDDPTAGTKPKNPVPDNPPPQVGNLPYAKPVPGKPGFVYSPYDDKGGYIDVRGFPQGSEVKDPYTGKNFLVPPQ